MSFIGVISVDQACDDIGSASRTVGGGMGEAVKGAAALLAAVQIEWLYGKEVLPDELWHCSPCW
jgi:hypothetical protein